jgi:AraC-like DNA-binding protein
MEKIETIQEIAYALGFNEVTNFTTFFKKHLQTSPAKFRNARLTGSFGQV